MTPSQFDPTPPRGGLRRLRAGLSIEADSHAPSGPRSPDQLAASLRTDLDRALAEERTVLVLKVRHRAFPGRAAASLNHGKLPEEIQQRLRSIEPTIIAVASSDTEMVAYVPSLRRRSDGEELVALALRALTPPLDIEGLPHYLSPTIGAALLDRENPTADLLLDASALALAETDNAHPGVMFHPYQRVRHDRNTEVEQELKAAVLANTTSVALQPALDLKTGEIRALESFARWTRPGKGPVLALDLVHITEEIGALHQLGRQVAERALRQISDWHEQGLLNDVTLWANISPSEVLHPEFPAMIMAAMEIDPRIKVGIELSPSPPSGEKYVNGVIRSLVARGARAAIGDFGSGYVDLSTIHQLPFDSVKLDRSLTRQIVGSDRAAEMVGVLIGLAGKLGLEVTAQGIENQAQAELLTQMGCPIGQGFYFARPMEQAEMDTYLNAR